MEKPLRRRFWLSAALVVLAPAFAVAQQRMLTIDDIYDPSMRVNFSGSSMGELVWIDGAQDRKSTRLNSSHRL